MKLRKNSQFKNKVRYLPSLALAAVSLLVAGEAKAASFTFTTIADNIQNAGNNKNSFVSFGQGLGTAGSWWSGYDLAFGASQYGISISNSGRVAYYAKRKDGVEGIYTGLNPATNTLNDLRVIASTDGIYKSFGQGISINNSLGGADTEDVAFFATLDNGESGIYRVKLGKTDSSDPNIVNTNGIFSGFAPGLSLNDNNTVAFLANLDSGGQDIFKSDGTTTTRITNCATNNFLECPLLKGSQEENSPSINNDGTVAFASENGVFTGDGESVSIIVSDPNNFLNGSYREANINNSGFVSALTYNGGADSTHSGGHIIFSSDGYDGSIIAGNNVTSTRAEDFRHVGTSSINNSGNVAFMAKGPDTGNGIYIGRDAVKNKVIAVGDYFNVIGNTTVNSKVVDLSFDRQSLNDSGDIAFWAKFENGIEGIFRSNRFGTSQFNPWMPNCKINNGSIYSFCDVSSFQWYDPPTTNGFTYKTNDDSLFTSILDLPSTFENPFTVSVGDIVLGQFSNGDEINFSKYADLLGDLLIGGTGLKEFSVRTHDPIDPTNPMVLPIKLAFNTETANFSMYALESVDQKKVPEPGTILGLLSIGSFLCYSGRRRQQKKD
jgi:hypothetical protein